MKTIISVKGAEFVAYHGFFDSEQKTGHTFIVDVDITTIYDEENDNLADTINYQRIYDIIVEEMKTPQRLLETVLQNIIKKCYSRFLGVDHVYARIGKLQPQLGGKLERTQIVMEK